MPTTLPSPTEARSLELGELATLAVLIGHMRVLDLQMKRVTRRLQQCPSERDEARLLAGARRWLDYHARAAVILGLPEPPEAQEVRAIFRGDAAWPPSNFTPPPATTVNASLTMPAQLYGSLGSRAEMRRSPDIP